MKFKYFSKEKILYRLQANFELIILLTDCEQSEVMGAAKMYAQLKHNRIFTVDIL
jgi:hypothetical protein